MSRESRHKFQMDLADFYVRADELRAENLPPLTWSVLLKETDGQLTDDEKARLDDYFKSFVAMPQSPEGASLCICCRKVMRGGIEGFLLSGGGESTRLEWALAHGEAFCVSCRWPYRVLHYDIGGKENPIIQRMQMALAVHPSLVLTRDEAEPAS